MTGCMSEYSGTDATCQWSRDAAGQLDLKNETSARHLSEDAWTAEAIAVRYADGHDRPGTAFGATMESYNNTRDQCMASLFQTIADQHHVTPQQVRESITTHRRTSVDAIVILSFALLYAFVASRFCRRIWLRFPPDEGTLPGSIATLVISPVAGWLGLVLGEGWSRYSETLRMGYGHLNVRAERIPWSHHREIIFATGVVIFWIVSWLRRREPASGNDLNPPSLGLTPLIPPQ